MQKKSQAERLEELSLLVVSKNVDKPYFGLRELMSTLFLLDALSTSELGHPLTDLRYEKIPTGPDVPSLSPTALTSDLLNLDISELEDGVLVALRPADLSVFSIPERELILRVTDQLHGATMEEFEYFTHDWMSRYTQLPLWSEIPKDAALIV